MLYKIDEDLWEGRKRFLVLDSGLSLMGKHQGPMPGIGHIDTER